MLDPDATGDLRLPPPRFARHQDLLGATILALPSDADPNESGTAGKKIARLRQSPGDSGDAGSSAWVLIPSPPRVRGDDGPLWHYTDAGGARGILESGALRATSLLCLNDSAEYSHGRSVLDQLAAELKTSRYVHPAQKVFVEQMIQLSDELVSDPGLYVLCASLAGESLAQWRSYGGASPHALLLDPTVDLAVVSDSTTQRTIDSALGGWARVIYEPEEQRAFLLNVLSYVAHITPFPQGGDELSGEKARAVARAITQALTYCKDPSFAEEREARLVVNPPSDTALRFRSGSMGIVPYLNLTASGAPDKFTVDSAATVPIRSAVVGPFRFRAESAVGLKSLLRSTGYADVQVSVSTSTQR